MPKRMIASVTTNQNGAILEVSQESRGAYRGLKAHITGGTGTVTLQGRAASDDSNWTDIAAMTATGTLGVLLMPHVRVVISGISGATIDVWLDAEGTFIG